MAHMIALASVFAAEVQRCQSYSQLGYWGCSGSTFEWYFILGYYGTHYRVRLYLPFGYSISYEEYNLHQKTLLIWFRVQGLLV